MNLQLAVDQRLAIYIPVIGAVTGAIMKFTDDWFDRKRFGPLVNFVVGVMVVVIVDALWGPFVAREAILKGLLVAASTSGLYDTVKAGIAIKNGKNNNKNNKNDKSCCC